MTMLDNFLISKKEVIKFKVSSKNPFALNCEKVTQKPRAFNTAQIKDATENIAFLYDEEDGVSDLQKKIIEYLLKDSFLYMHQTGLYNRQFKLWKTMGNITQCSISVLQEGLLKKKDLNAYIIDFYIDPKNPCFNAVVLQDSKELIETEGFYKKFKMCLLKALKSNRANRLKGIFCFLDIELSNDFITKLNLLTESNDLISKYESILSNTNDVRLNVVSFKQKDRDYNFKHTYPQLHAMDSKKT